MPDGIDYAWGGPPSLTAMRRAGVTFVCRYLSHSPSKNLTPAEARTLSEGGFWIVAVWETTANRALSGYSGGAADARDALAQARSCGMPDDRPMFFAVDWDAGGSQQTQINAYLDGAASVLGRDRVGIYGGYGPVKRALDAGKATWAWQTYAWSGGQWDPRAHIQQYSNSHLLGGVDCDYDRAIKDDFGQWRVGTSPTPAPQPLEDDMAAVSSLGVDGKQVVKAGETASVVFTKEYSDKSDLHGDNGVSVVIAKDKYWVVADAIFELHGLAAGDEVDVAWTRVQDDGTFIDDAWRRTFTANSKGVVRDELGGQFGVDSTNRLRLRVYNGGSKDVTVQGCMVKAALLKY